MMTEIEFRALRDFVRRSEDPYTGFRIKKRRGGIRNIVSPNLQLKRVQRWLARHVLSRVPPHEASKAYAPKCSTVDVARLHCGSRWLVKIDITSFFESVSEIDVYNVFRSLEYSSLVSFELARICTRLTRSLRHKKSPWLVRYRRAVITTYWQDQLGHLPQGAPTSPMLANLVMREADELISKLAQESGLLYTRYSDDLIFSTTNEDFTRADAEALVRNVEGILARFQNECQQDDDSSTRGTKGRLGSHCQRSCS